LERENGQEQGFAAERQASSQPPPEAYRGDVLPPSSGPPPPPQYPPPYQPHHRGRGTGGIVLGVIVIVVGIVFLGQNLGWWSGTLHNWWALFILIPAVGSLTEAWRQYVGNGRRFGGNVARSLVIGLLLVFVTLVFLFDLSWAYIWPVVLILIGVGLLLGRWRRREG
jgi:hypothetical protein